MMNDTPWRDDEERTGEPTPSSTPRPSESWSVGRPTPTPEGGFEPEDDLGPAAPGDAAQEPEAAAHVPDEVAHEPEDTAHEPEEAPHESDDAEEEPGGRRFTCLAALILIALLACGALALFRATESEEVVLIRDECDTSCHGLDQVREADLSYEGWRSTVIRMENHGADLTDEERETVIDYLANTGL